MIRNNCRHFLSYIYGTLNVTGLVSYRLMRFIYHLYLTLPSLSTKILIFQNDNENDHLLSTDFWQSYCLSKYGYKFLSEMAFSMLHKFQNRVFIIRFYT